MSTDLQYNNQVKSYLKKRKHNKTAIEITASTYEQIFSLLLELGKNCHSHYISNHSTNKSDLFES